MDVKNNTHNTIPPPLRAWSGNLKNQGSMEKIPAYWEANDFVTFLVDLEKYPQTLSDTLDAGEKEQVRKFKTEYFKKRFTVSRTLLKLILQQIPGDGRQTDILLGKEKKGRIILHGRPDVFISLSYSGPYIAITIGKKKIGCDLELLRPIKDKKISSCPVFRNYPSRDDKAHLKQVIHVWTLIESYAKLYDENSYSLLGQNTIFKDVNFASYCINKHLIFSLASEKKEFNDIVVWFDLSSPDKT